MVKRSAPIRLAVLAGLSILLVGENAACGGGGGADFVGTEPPLPTLPPSSPPAVPPSPLPGDVVLTVGNGGQTFLSETTTVTAGTRVFWDWNDSQSHSTTSDTNVWNSGIQAGQDKAFALTFNIAGTFPYHCQVHGSPGGVGMSGTIVVTP